MAGQCTTATSAKGGYLDFPAQRDLERPHRSYLAGAAALHVPPPKLLLTPPSLYWFLIGRIIATF
jgi:hypothetical protein